MTKEERKHLHEIARLNGRERNFVGYGRHLPRVEWPKQARMVVSFVVNYEEGGERNLLDGDERGETFGDINYPMPDGVRDLAAESNFEYGSRVGVWRLLDTFQRHEIPTTFFASGRALERNPEVGQALSELGHEPCSHGHRWGEHFRMTEEEEQQEIRNAVRAIERTTGSRPVGWYCRYGPSERTRRLLAQEGGFLYDSDAYNDDLPYYVSVLGRPWLVVPYSADVNDGRYFATPDEFYAYAAASLDQLWDEGTHTPVMLSVGLHARISGRPGRARGLDRFIRYARSKGDIWFARRDEIARFWLSHHLPT